MRASIKSKSASNSFSLEQREWQTLEAGDEVMRKEGLLFGVLLAVCAAVFADSPPETFPPGNYSTVGDKRLVASVEATVQVVPPTITLKIHNPSTYNIYRKDLGATDWGSAVYTTAPSDTAWADTNVTVDTIYEYRISYNVENLSSSTTDIVPTGYVTAGIRVDRSETYHGRVILCIDQTITNALAYEIDRLKKDLAGDGWRTETLFVEPSDSSVWADGQRAQLVRSNLYSIYTNAPADDKPVAVYLLGHVPAVKSGYDEDTPDGHAAGGAKPADSYYGDLDGVWTDIETWDPASPPPGYDQLGDDNLPGDYIWDQDIIPSDVELAVGRVDVVYLPDMNASEETLLRRYLDKAHTFRQAEVQPNMGVLHQDGNQITDEFAWRELIPICGLTNYQYTTADNITNDDAVNETDYANKYGPYLFFEQASGGAPKAAEFAQYGSQVVFWNGWQSGWWKWTKWNSEMRAGLASEGLTLGYWSAGRCGWFMQHVAMGLPVSYSLKQTMNNNRLAGPYYFQKTEVIQSHGSRDSSQRVWMNYMGDPTIRWFTVLPPSNLTGQTVGSDVQLSWAASAAENLEGYRVFRATGPQGPFTNELTSSIITTTTYTDLSAPAGDHVYMVKSVALQQTGSGTFLNPSQGVTVPVYTNAPWTSLSPEEGALAMLFQKASLANEQTLSITNLGGGTLSGLSATSPANWLDIALDTNTLTLTLQPNAQADSLAPGTHVGNIAVQATGAEPYYLRVVLDVDEEIVPVLSTHIISVPEGSTNVFQIRLSVNPGLTTTISVNRASGDGDISVFGPTQFTFTTNNWNTNQPVVLQAAEDDGEWLDGTTMVHCVISGGATGILTAVEADNDIDPSTILPFTETFETLLTGTLDGQHGWSGGGTVQTSTVHGGSQALALTNETASHTFADNPTNVWVTVWAQPILSELAGEIPSNAVAPFYVNTNAQVVAYSNAMPITITTPTVISNDWNKFEVFCDYSSKVWKLSLNGTELFDDFGFYSDQTAFSTLELIEGPAAASYFDDLEITDSQNDSDGDGLPDDWEILYYGGLSPDLLDMASNGVNTVEDAYIAGFDPTDPDASFTLDSVGPLQWTAASGRVYTIWWTSNLLSNFQPLESNYTGGAFTDLTHSTDTEGFYKIDVRVE